VTTSATHREIERKFLVTAANWRQAAQKRDVRQGYLSLDKERTVRVRLAAGKGTITIKGMSQGIARPEFEYGIPSEDARALLDQLCLRPLIEKTRYLVPWGGLTWEVDVFEGENEGLIVAEVELASEDQEIELPDWIGEEVTGDPRYFNASLVAAPYNSWKAA
jgi:adenylate cyclase